MMMNAGMTMQDDECRYDSVGMMMSAGMTMQDDDECRCDNVS